MHCFELNSFISSLALHAFGWGCGWQKEDLSCVVVNFAYFSSCAICCMLCDYRGRGAWADCARRHYTGSRLPPALPRLMPSEDQATHFAASEVFREGTVNLADCFSSLFSHFILAIAI